MKKLKKIISTIIIAVLLISALPFSASATPTHTMTLSFREGETEDIVVSVFIPQPEKLTAIDFSLELSSDILDIAAFSIDGTDTALYVADFEDIQAPSPENAFTYTTTVKTNSVTFSGFFVNSLTSEKNFHLCDIVISKDGAFSEDDLFTFSYTLTCELCTKTDKQVYSLTEKDLSDTKIKKSLPLGDADLDGQVNASDARRILRASVGLDTLSLEEFPYANSDYDEKISSADARYALRTSVGLEKTVMHNFDISLDEISECENGGNYTFICAVTGISFSMVIENGGHLCHDTDCFNTGKCEICNEVIHPATGHKFDKNGICTVCAANKDQLDAATEKLIPVLEEINTFDILADEALNSNKRIDFISNTQAATKCIKNAAEICKGIKGLEKVEEHLMTAYKIRFQSFVSVMDDNGEILSSSGNCNTILVAVKQSNQHIDYASYLYE